MPMPGREGSGPRSSSGALTHEVAPVFRGVFWLTRYHILTHEIVSGTHDGRSRRPIDPIALLKREEEQAPLDTPLMGGTDPLPEG